MRPVEHTLRRAAVALDELIVAMKRAGFDDDARRYIGLAFVIACMPYEQRALAESPCGLSDTVPAS